MCNRIFNHITAVINQDKTRDLVGHKKNQVRFWLETFVKSKAFGKRDIRHKTIAIATHKAQIFPTKFTLGRSIVDKPTGKKKKQKPLLISDK